MVFATAQTYVLVVTMWRIALRLLTLVACVVGTVRHVWDVTMFQAVAREWISATFVAVTMLAWTAMVSQMEMQSSDRKSVV